MREVCHVKKTIPKIHSTNCTEFLCKMLLKLCIMCKMILNYYTIIFIFIYTKPFLGFFYIVWLTVEVSSPIFLSRATCTIKSFLPHWIKAQSPSTPQPPPFCRCQCQTRQWGEVWAITSLSRWDFSEIFFSLNLGTWDISQTRQFHKRLAAK